MKKLFVYLLPMFMLIMSACNEDATKNDDNLKAQLVGNWTLSTERIISSDETSVLTSIYRLDADGKFIHSESVRTTKLDAVKAKVFSVSGTWSVFKAQLQLAYDLNSITTSGYSDAEDKALRNMLRDENLMLQDMNKQGDPYGMTVKISTASGKTYLQLGTINGQFEKTTMPFYSASED